MKPISLILSAWIILSVLSCSPGGNGDDRLPTIIPFKVVMIKHPVKDYVTWKQAYMADDSARLIYGISKLGLGRAMDDPNMVIIFNKITDLQKAREFASTPNLRESMEKAGVTGPPTFAYFEVLRNDTTKIPQKDRVMISHRVKDFNAWLKVFDKEGRTDRSAYGLLDRGMARDLDDPNMVYMVFAITDMAKAKARITSPELKKLMTDAGVEGPPSIFFYTLDK